MQTLTKSILALLFVGTLTFSANAKEVAPENNLKQELSSLMSGISLPEGENFEAEVEFLVNEDNEIVIVSVDTEHEFLEDLIKYKLNYREVKSEAAVPNKVNKVKFTFKQP